MSDTRDQRIFWSDEAGPLWVEQRAAMDIALAGVLDHTLARAGLKPGDSVLDIGCGAGTSTLAIAATIGNSGHVTGVDISTTLLAAAQARSTGQSNVAYLDADAQTFPFAPGSADAIVSRFGVMFFEDSVAAFANMARALRVDGRFSFAAWGEIAENPFFTLPAQIARQILGPVPRSDPDAPGPVTFRNPDKVARILTDAGLIPHVETVQEPLVMAQDAQALARVMCHIGPANKALGHYNADQSQHSRLMDAIAQALAPFETPQGIALPTQINYVTARKPS